MTPTEPETSHEMDEADVANGEGPSDRSAPEPGSPDQRAQEYAEREGNDPVETP